MVATDRPRDQRSDVAIVGAGPTGIVTAIRLAERGISSVLVESSPAPTHESRAALIHASSIEILDRIGIGDRLIAHGRRVEAITIADGDRLLARIGFNGLSSPYPFALSLPQSDTEHFLIERLAELGGAVHRRQRATAVSQDADGCILSVVDEATQQPWRIRSRYVVAADGTNGIIRDLAGIGITGAKYADDFVLADVDLHPQPAPSHEARICFSPHGVTVLGMLPSGRMRVIATAIRGQPTPPAPDRTYLDALFTSRRVGAGTRDEPVWSSRFRIAHQIADHFRKGRIFLCGDAAHVHSPAAGQGMNTGVADAYDLADRLADACSGHQSGLDGYEPARRPAALQVIKFTDRMTSLALARSSFVRGIRNTGLRVIYRLPPAKSQVVTWVSGINRSPVVR